MFARVITAITIGSLSSNLITRTVDMTCDQTFKILSQWGTRHIESFPELYEAINRLDIRTRVSRVRQLVSELEAKLPDSVVQSIGDVVDVINRINVLLDDIQRAENYQRKLYFSNWRRFDCHRFITDLCYLNTLLESRMKFLETVLNITSNTQAMSQGQNKVVETTLLSDTCHLTDTCQLKNNST
jgi:hypothetical protein